jgi:hypothetical protein
MNLPNLAGRVGVRGFFSLTTLGAEATLEAEDLADETTGVDILRITSELVGGFTNSVLVENFFNFLCQILAIRPTFFKTLSKTPILKGTFT